jgi:amino acid adenylation domain-containing protein
MTDLSSLTSRPDLAGRLAALSPHKRALFEKLLADAARAEDTFPLSVFQEGMWFLEQMYPGNPAYLGISAVRIEGPVRVELLARAMNDVVRRHELARTTFELRDGRPTQVVHPAAAVEVPEIDLRGAPLTEEELEQRVIATALCEPLDIEAAPPVRLALLRTADEEWVLVAAAHHLLFDRQAFGILLDELSTVYDALAQDRPSPLREPAIQYGDFAAWQCRQRDEGRWEPDLAYWREHLAGAPAALELPTDRPRPPVQGFRGAQLPIELPEELMQRLSALANQHGATTYMALLAVYSVLLHRYGNADDVVVGVPASVRDRPEIGSLLGYFINTLPVRTRLGGDPTFVQVLDQVRASCLGAYEHQEVPFDMIVADLNTPRDLSRPPIYQASFTYGREPVPAAGFGGARLTRLPVRSDGARFDLELQAFHKDGALRGWFDYDRDLFDESTIARLAGHFRRLIDAVVADPEQCVDRIELLTGEERRRVLVELNDTARQWPAGDGWIHQCIERQVRQRPDAPAVRFEGRTLTYRELNRRANQLAHRLIRAGVGRDVLVGVAMQRSLELVVALLAVVKAGGAYVPLDPEYPPARLEYMVGDAKVAVLLTQRGVRDVLPPVPADVLCVDELAAELAGELDHDPQVGLDGSDLAYVIYTSGSTGQPKGVMNVHAGIRNRLLWMQDAFGLDATDRVLQKTPFSFDVSVWEFFWPLMTGATLVVARPGGHRDAGYLAGLIRDEAVTTVHFVPSMLQAFLAEPVERCTTLRRVICSGEALPRDLQDRFLARSGAQLHNLYGPTEAAIDVTHWVCRSDDPPGPVPIGRPIANTQVYVLDRYLRPVPIGVAGELHLGGQNLARGYLNRDRLTAERFIPDPFDPTPGARLYRTGDLARLRADGAVEFLGRLDHQVKLRGYRIELGEIEAALAALPGVREAVVLAPELRPGDVRLVAYLTVEAGAVPDPAALAAALRRELPEYMVPAFFEVLDALPLTPNGKIDRKVLPEPAYARRESAAPFVAPLDGLEDTIAGVWREVLGVERVGRDDNFFDLGGHSLLMAQLRTLLAERTGRELSIVELFQHPSVAALAEHLGREPRSPESLGQDAHERAETRRRSLGRRQHIADRRTSTHRGR